MPEFDILGKHFDIDQGSCVAYGRSFLIPLGLPDVMDLFPSATPINSGAQYNDARRSRPGVYIFPKGSFCLVRVVGSCPNWGPDGCRLRERCILAEIEGNDD